MLCPRTLLRIENLSQFMYGHPLDHVPNVGGESGIQSELSSWYPNLNQYLGELSYHTISKRWIFYRKGLFGSTQPFHMTKGP